MRYERYRKTGISWLPEVPEGWEMVLNQFLFKENIRPPSQMDRPLSLSQVDGLLPTDDMKERSLKTSTYEGWKRVLKDDLVLNRFKAHLGVFFASKYEGMVSFHYGVFAKRRSLLPRYYEYLFHTPQYKFVYSWASKGMTIGLQNLSNTDFYKVRSPYPPEEEQRRIVSFLDSKCGKIDRLVAAKEKEAALLKELKQSMIAEAVTGKVECGVRSAECGVGDFNAEAQRRRARRGKTKLSGIPWLPEVPEGWEVRRLKNLFKLRNESYSSDEKLQVLSLLKDVGVIPYEEKGNIGNKSKEDYSTYNVARKGDIVMNSMNVIIGSVDISDYDGYISPAYYAITARDGVDAKYYNYVFHLRAVQKHMRTLAKGILEIRLRISTTALFGMAFPLPPLPEQKAIVAYIEARAEKIDAAVAGLEREITALKEYRERLVADVVTGQRKVA